MGSVLLWIGLIFMGRVVWVPSCVFGTTVFLGSSLFLEGPFWVPSWSPERQSCSGQKAFAHTIVFFGCLPCRPVFGRLEYVLTMHQHGILIFVLTVVSECNL